MKSPELFQAPSMVLDGITKRELFAAMAMQGMLAEPNNVAEMNEPERSRYAVYCADSLIAELDK